MSRPSIYQSAGGDPAFLALATAHHARCLVDPVLEHPFSRTKNPEHVQRLAEYWAEVFGGPARYSGSYGGHSGMIGIHACNGEDEPGMFGDAFLRCFVGAMDDAGLPGDPELRAALRAYMEWAVAEVEGYLPKGSVVPSGMAMPRWSWDGLQ